MTRLRMAAVAVVAVFLVFTASSGASGAWTAGPKNLTAAPAAATATATLTGTGSLATSYKFAVGASSPAVVSALTVTNTGTAPLNYQLQAAATGTLPGISIALSVWMPVAGACGSTVPTGAGIATTGTVAAPPALPTAAQSAAPGVGFVLCAATSLATTVKVSQGLSSSVVLTMNGTVGTSWVAPATGAAFTQSVFRTADPSAIGCTNKTGILGGLFGNYVTLTWTAPAAADTGTGLSYSIERSTAPTGVAKTSTTRTVDLAWGDIQASPQTILIKSVETQYGTTSAGAPITLTGSSGVLGLLLGSVSCP